MRTSGELTDWYRRMWRPNMAKVKPDKVIRVLQEAGVRFVLMGAHGVSGYRDEPRSTQDVDVLVNKRDHEKAVAAIREAFPKLKVKDTSVVTRFLDPSSGKPAIDLMKARGRLDELTFKNAVSVGDYLIPELEMALAAKYAAMISPQRLADKRMVDAGDSVNMIRENGAKLDVKKLRRFGNLVYKGGGDEIMRYFEDAKAGRTLAI